MKDDDLSRPPHSMQTQATRTVVSIGRENCANGDFEPLVVGEVYIDGKRYVEAASPESSERLIAEFLKKLATALAEVQTYDLNEFERAALGEGEPLSAQPVEHGAATLSIQPDGSWHFCDAVYRQDEECVGVSYRRAEPMTGRSDIKDVTGGESVSDLLWRVGMEAYIP